jgi:hypothetical protein
LFHLRLLQRDEFDESSLFKSEQIPLNRHC